jgi:S1-C subfamily serine protease
MSNPTSSTSNLGALSSQMADAMERAAASLVTVYGRDRQAATGIVIGDGLVLASEHTLERDDNLQIETPDGRKLPAMLGGRDGASDLALLKVANLNLPAATVAPRVGQLALAVGRPAPGGPMASLGIVSAVAGPLRLGNGRALERYLRTDATPYPGFSGGALIDAAGAVVGVMTTGLARGATIGIPFDLALRVAETLGKQGFVKRGYLGVVSQQVKLPSAQRAGLTQETGLLVVRVEEASPAEKGGMLMGDIIVSVAGATVADADDLLSALSGDRVGRALAIGVIRGGTLTSATVVVGERA